MKFKILEEIVLWSHYIRTQFSLTFFLTYLTQSGLSHFPAAEALQHFGMNIALSAFSKVIILRQSLECVPSAPNLGSLEHKITTPEHSKTQVERSLELYEMSNHVCV